MNYAALGASIMQVLRSKWFWIILISALLLFLAWKYWSDISDWWYKLTNRDVTDYRNDPPLTDADKAYLDTLAQELFAEFDGITFSTEKFYLAFALNGRKLNYLAGVYPHYSGGEDLKTAIQNELIAGDDDAILISRLSGMNL